MPEESEEKIKLSEPKAKIIAYLLKKPGSESSPKEIAKSLKTNEASVTENLRGLEEIQREGLNLVTRAWKERSKDAIKTRNGRKEIRIYKITNKELALKLLKASNFLSLKYHPKPLSSAHQILLSRSSRL